jgi:F0F1-type ATP synthase assembly protein I
MQNKNAGWTLAYQILSAMLIPIAAGYILDSNFNSLPAGIIVGSICGMLSVFVILFKMIKKSK